MEIINGKGMEISRQFFQEWGLPYLEKEFQDIAGRVAAGLFRGSQIFGADDALSHDHGWGPCFHLILTNEDHKNTGARLKTAINKEAPREWAGFKFRYPAESIEIDSIDNFFTKLICFADPPGDPEAWLMNFQFRFGNRENELYLIRHGEVFYDPLGSFSSRRKLFRFYPKPAKLRRINQELLHAWHFGQYNFVNRLSKRNDPVANAMAIGHFSEAVMRLCMLLDDDFTPYWKWLAFEFRKHAVAENLYPMLKALAQDYDIPNQVRIVGEICEFLHSLLREHGLAASDLSFHPHQLFCDLNKGPLSEYA